MPKQFTLQLLRLKRNGSDRTAKTPNWASSKTNGVWWRRSVRWKMSSRKSLFFFVENVQALRADTDELTAIRSGEEFFGALSKMGHDMREARALLQGRPGLDMTVVVNYKDVGGMTHLHRAARIGCTDLVQELMYLKAGANAATYPSRAPGSFTPFAMTG